METTGYMPGYNQSLRLTILNKSLQSPIRMNILKHIKGRDFSKGEGLLWRSKQCLTVVVKENLSSNCERSPFSQSSIFYKMAAVVAVIAGGTLLTVVAKVNPRKKSSIKIERYYDPNIKGMNDGVYKLRGVWMTPWLIKDEQSWLKIKLFGVKYTDVFVVSYPKSGTTWIQEVVYLITSDLNFEAEKHSNIADRCPFLEYPLPGLDAINKMPGKRLLKSHLPLSLLPDNMLQGKVIYIARNPKDTAVSLYHFWKGFTVLQYSGNFEDFCETFLDGKVGYGTWWDHVKSFWDVRNHRQVLFVTYEELHQNIKKVISDVANFLDKKLTDEDIEKIAEHCRFSSMKSNPSVNYEWMKEQGLFKNSFSFNRKGIIGDWKSHFSSEMAAKFDEKTVELSKQTGLIVCDESS